MGFFEKIRKMRSAETEIKCPDGTSRFVYKDPDDAFPLHVRDWSASVGASMSGLNQLKARLDADIKNQTGGFFVKLNKENGDMQLKFRALYTFYKTDPCNKDIWLNDEFNKILEKAKKENVPGNINYEVNKIESEINQGKSKQELTQLIAEAVAKASKSYIEKAISAELEKASANASAWGVET